MRNALVSAVFATAVLGVFVLAQPRSGAAHRSGDDGATLPSDLRVGAVCSSDIGYATDVSCGLASFGDVRFLCPAGTRTAPCPRTRTVTLQNTGRTDLRLVGISGSAPGVRHETVSRLLRPGARAALGPRDGDTYLYDIVLRSGGGRTEARVTALS
ncbi:hypothetical protein ACIP98_35680 [Streptomyces sp. NPDC088354]|uniref:hypothetical protein n=1 Tax=Streptomyces sp. NPDC088354 TaxID=3365856 RepID=UPI003826BA63